MYFKKVLIFLIFISMFFCSYSDYDIESYTLSLNEKISEKTPEESFSLEVLEITASQVKMEIEQRGDSEKIQTKTLKVGNTLKILNDFKIEIISLNETLQETQIDVSIIKYYELFLDTSDIWCNDQEAELRLWALEDYENKEELEKDYGRELDSLNSKLKRAEEREDKDDIKEFKEEIEDLRDEYFQVPRKIKIQVYNGPFTSSPLLKEFTTDDIGVFEHNFIESKYYLTKIKAQENFLSYETLIKVESCDSSNIITPKNNNIEEATNEEEVEEVEIEVEDEMIEETNEENEEVVQETSFEDNSLNNNLEEKEEESINFIEENQTNSNETKVIVAQKEEVKINPFLVVISLILLGGVGFIAFLFLRKRSVSQIGKNIEKGLEEDLSEKKDSDELKASVLKQTIDYLEKYKDSYSKESLRLVLENNNVSEEVIQESFKQAYKSD